MKKLLIILLLPLCFGCATPTHEMEANKADIILTTENGSEWISVHEVTIEGCQYFYSAGNRQGALSHKGNCNNPIHNQ